MFVSALFKTVFHLIFNAKTLSILEITFCISFICNDLDLTDILSKTENALSTAIYQSEVRQLEKNIKFTGRPFASICLSVKTPKTTQITLNEHQNQPFQLQTTSCPQTHHTKHHSTRYGPAHDTLVLIAYSQKFYLIWWCKSESSKGPGETARMHRLVWAFGCSKYPIAISRTCVRV